MDQPTVQLPSWQRPPSSRASGFAQLSPPDHITHLLGNVPVELRSLVAGYESSREQTLTATTRTPFDQQEILATLHATTEVMSIRGGRFGDGYVMEYWQAAENSTSECTNTSIIAGINYMTLPGTMKRQPIGIEYVLRTNQECLSKDLLAAKFINRGRKIRIIDWSGPKGVETFLDVKCIFLMFKRRFTDRHIPNPIESARVQASKFLERFCRFFRRQPGIEYIYFIYLYLSGCVMVMHLDITVEYVAHEITPETTGEIQRQCDVYYAAVMGGITKLM